MPGQPAARDARYMRRAIELAGRGWGRVHPNPLVGALVVAGDEVVGEGWHAAFGGPHAEVVALDEAGQQARGGTVYVTLEPCAHRGKTPPCTDALIRAGVARVVYGASDPHPEAAGGAARLRDAGIEVVGGIERDRVRAQNAPFLHGLDATRPFVALKYGLTLDARIARSAGESTRVTGPESEQEVHRLRAGFDALLVGIETVLCDDPLLTVRGAVQPSRPPIRAVVDTEARLPTDGQLARTAESVRVWVACAGDAAGDRSALEDAGIRVLPVERGPGGLSLPDLMARLWDEGVRTVLCEGGGRLGSALLSAGLVDRLYLFYAPRLFGDEGVPAFTGMEAAVPADWGRTAVRTLGQDVLITLDRRS